MITVRSLVICASRSDSASFPIAGGRPWKDGSRSRLLDSRQFYLAVKRLADSLSYGTDRSPFLGSGLEYVQSRPYQYGDPIKSIDWRVTARTRRVHVKEYEAPKRMPVYLLVDTSASMTISSHHPSKYETAVFLAGGLALAVPRPDQPGGRARRRRPEPARPAEPVEGPGPPVAAPAADLPLRRADRRSAPRIAELTPSLAQRVLVIVLSDLHDPGALPALKRLGQEHDCAVLQLRDPAEDRLRGVGFVRAREAETGRAFVARGRGDWLDQERRRGRAQAGRDRPPPDRHRPAVRVAASASSSRPATCWAGGRGDAMTRHDGCPMTDDRSRIDGGRRLR